MLSRYPPCFPTTKSSPLLPTHTHTPAHQPHSRCVLVKMIYNFQKFSFAFAIHTQANCLCAFCLFTANRSACLSPSPYPPAHTTRPAGSSHSQPRPTPRQQLSTTTGCCHRISPRISLLAASTNVVAESVACSATCCSACSCCATRCRHVAAESVSRQIYLCRVTAFLRTSRKTRLDFKDAFFFLLFLFFPHVLAACLGKLRKDLAAF